MSGNGGKPMPRAVGYQWHHGKQYTLVDCDPESYAALERANGMKELEGQHCRIQFLKDQVVHGDSLLHGWVVIEKVDMPMIKLRNDYDGASSRWVNASLIGEIVPMNRSI